MNQLAMSWDVTTIGIAVGVIGALAFMALELSSRHDNNLDFVDVGTKAGIVFLAIFAIFPSIELIWAGVEGNRQNLPPHWRAHVAAAGVIGVGYSLKFLIRTFRALIQESSNKEK